MTARAPVLVLAAWLALPSCGGEPPQTATLPSVLPMIVDMAQLDAHVKQNLGRGCLVNVWATY